MKRILAMLLSVICVLSFTCVSTYADEKSEDEEKAASIAESYLSAAAKNMWLYELLAPGAHSQFGSGKNTQFEPEQRANPFENVVSKTAVFPPPAIAETDL